VPQDIQRPDTSEAIQATAQSITHQLETILRSETESGRAEIRNAALVVAELCRTQPALSDAIVSAAAEESRPWMAEVLAQGNALLDTHSQKPDLPNHGQDMEL